MGPLGESTELGPGRNAEDDGEHFASKWAVSASDTSTEGARPRMPLVPARSTPPVTAFLTPPTGDPDRLKRFVRPAAAADDDDDDGDEDTRPPPPPPPLPSFPASRSVSALFPVVPIFFMSQRMGEPEGLRTRERGLGVAPFILLGDSTLG